MALQLDQEQTGHDWGAYPLPSVGHKGKWRSQRFTAGLNGALERIDLWVGNQYCLGDLRVEVRTVEGDGSPSSTILASETIPTSEITGNRSTGAEIEVIFASPAIISLGTEYSIVLYVVNGENYDYGYYIFGSSEADPYPNGEWWFSNDYGESWSKSGGFTSDYYFQTYVEIIPEILKNITNDFRMSGTFATTDVINDFRLIGAILSNVINDFRMAGTFSLIHIINDFRSRLTSLNDIFNKFSIVKLIKENIISKFNLADEVKSGISNLFNFVGLKVFDVISDFRSHKKEISNVANDFRMIASWQVPGDAGIEALGKSAFMVKINGVDKTSLLDLDSLRWKETLNSSATASFKLAIPYDSASCPSENQSVEILFNNHRKFYGYISNINKLSNPEGIEITAEDEYWNLNKSNVDFKVGRKISDDPSTYYNTIAEALSACEFSAGIGGFIPEVIECVGAKADIISQLVQECGNFGWFIKPNGTKKLSQAGKGDIIELERQEIGKNLGLYQVIDHNITTEDSSSIVNRLKVIMGEDILPGFSNEFRFAYIEQKYTQYSPEYMEYYRDGEAFPDYNRWHWSSISWLDRREDTDQQAYEAYIDAPAGIGGGKFKITVPPGMVPGYPLSYKGTVAGKIENWLFGGWVVPDGLSLTQDLLAENTKVNYSYRRYYRKGGIYPEGRRERVFYITNGSYPHTITKDLVLSGLNVQYGVNYKEWEGRSWSESEQVQRGDPGDEQFPATLNYTKGKITDKPFKIPSWNDEAYARDYANWQLSKTCDTKETGTIRITMDCADFYALDLSKRIKVSGIVDSPINIISIDYDVGSYVVTINVESARYHARSVSIPIHLREE